LSVSSASCSPGRCSGNRIESAARSTIKRFLVLDSTVRPLALAEHGDEGLVEPSLQLPWMTLWFKRTPAQEDALARLLAEQQNNSSEKYHKWLTPEEYAKEFGLSPGDIERVAAWLEGQGFRVEYRANDRDFISFSGTADQVRDTFQTEIHRYTIRGESHYINATSPSVPEALSDVVLSLQGLTDVHLQPRVMRGKPAVTLHPNEDNGDGTESLAPDDIATIYNITPLYQQGISGAGQSIAVLGGSGINLDDIRAFRSHYNLKGADPQIIECCGTDPGETMDEAELEADLDVEWSSAVARSANIIFVYAPNPIDTVQYVVDHNVAPVFSESFGVCEAGAVAMGLSFDTYRSLAQAANAKGMTWLDASGDSGAADCDSSNNSAASMGLAVEFPASIPEVTGVGGTEFNEGIGTFWSGTNGPDLGSSSGLHIRNGVERHPAGRSAIRLRGRPKLVLQQALLADRGGRSCRRHA
jgi:subtilase family serine protease